MDHVREEKYAQQAHEVELARIEIARTESIGAMSDSAKVALAAGPNAAALADVMKTQVHANMSAEQLAAINSVTPQEAARQLQQQLEREQARRDAEVDKDRRHQLDLLTLQNDVNKAALAKQAELGTGVAQATRQTPSPRTCPNGHRAGPNDKFCTECGAAIQP